MVMMCCMFQLTLTLSNVSTVLPLPVLTSSAGTLTVVERVVSVMASVSCVETRTTACIGVVLTTNSGQEWRGESMTAVLTTGKRM